MRLSIALAFLLMIVSVSAQLAMMFGVSLKEGAGECESMDEWWDSKCQWYNNKKDSHWGKPMLEQLSPTCKATEFVQMINKTVGKVIHSINELFRLVSDEERPCGFCSYHMRCGQNCKRQFFEAEEKLCELPQNKACRLAPGYFNSYLVPGDCKIWPHPLIDLSSLHPIAQAEAKASDWFSCVQSNVPGTNQTSCYCCCAPYRPHPDTLECLRGDSSKWSSGIQRVLGEDKPGQGRRGPVGVPES